MINLLIFDVYEEFMKFHVISSLHCCCDSRAITKWL